jgi:hypothetical protein
MGQCYSFLYDCLEQRNVPKPQTQSKTTKSSESIPLLAPIIPPLSNGNNSHKEHSHTAPVPIVVTDKSAPVSAPHLITSEYELKEVIGVGSTATCHRVVHRLTGLPYACKVIDKRQVDMKFSGLLDQFHVEISVLKQLRHPNIVALEDVFETNERIYMVHPS